MSLDWCYACRLDDALNLVKLLASKHGAMQQTTLNSLIRSLLNANQAPRALRMLSIMLNMGLRPYRTTIDALIAGCAQNSNSVEAAKFYWWAAFMCCVVGLLVSWQIPM